MEAAARIPMSGRQSRFVIDDSSKVGEARRAAQALANFEFDTEVAGKVAIAATELANNLLLHADRGELLMQTLGAEDSAIVELLAIDRGPGMTDVARCMTDGYSTAGTPGTGLGAVRRLAHDFHIHSVPGEGTVVLARFGAAQPRRFGAISVALDGEIDCGDAWSLVHRGDTFAMVMADGLGHGTFAAEAARACVNAFAAAPWDAPKIVLERANRAMSRTRGGAPGCPFL